jgi:hypothetical protein
MAKTSDQLPEIRLDDVVVAEKPRPVPRGMISAETERELRAAAEDLARGAPVERDLDVSLEVDAPPVFPSALSAEPAATASLPVVNPPSDAALEEMLTDLDGGGLREAVAGLSPVDLASGLPSVVAPEDDPLAPHLPLSMEEPPAVSRISMDQLMPDPKALEALQRLAGAAGQPERTRKALNAAIGGGNYNPGHLPDARVMLVGIAKVLAAHGLPVDEMVEAIMESLTD